MTYHTCQVVALSPGMTVRIICCGPRQGEYTYTATGTTYSGGWSRGLKAGRGELHFGPKAGRMGVYVGCFRQVSTTPAL